MTEISFYELRTFERFDALGVAVGAVLLMEADMGVANGNYARVAVGSTTDIEAEVFDDVLAAAEGLEVDAPVLLPDGGIDGGQ